MLRWEDREAFLRDEARRDLEAGADVRPCLVAMRGAEPLLMGFFRAFGPGRHLDPLLELLALAAPLGADRLALSVTGLAARTDQDPSRDPPRHVLVVDEVDGSAEQGGVAACTSVWAYHTTSQGLAWEAPIRTPGGTGAVSAALRLAVTERSDLRASVTELRAQAERCVRLGHLLALAPRVHQELCG